MRPRAVLLDLYLTLVEPDWPRLIEGRTALAEKVGIDPAACLRAWDATHLDRMLGMFGTLEDDLAAVFAAAGSGGSQAQLDPTVLTALAEEERANWRDAVRIYPDVPPELRRLRAAGVRLAIVTNASAEAAGVVPSLGLDRLVDVTLASCETGVTKPELLERALGALGVDAGDAALIDDDPENIRGARELGMRAVLIRRGGEAPAVPGDEGREAPADLIAATASLFGPQPATPG